MFSTVYLIAPEQTFSLIRNAKGIVTAANNRKPQSFVKGGNRRANRKLSVPRRENLQISYLTPFLPSCHYNQGAMRSLHLKPCVLVLPLFSSFSSSLYCTLSRSSLSRLPQLPVHPPPRLFRRPTRLGTGFRAPNLYAI